VKTRSAVLALGTIGALAAFPFARDRWDVRETAAAANDSSLPDLAVPGANATTIIEPRDSVVVAPAIPASTMPRTSAATAPKAGKPAATPAAKTAAVPVAKPAPTTTPAPVATPTPTPSPVTTPPAVTPPAPAVPITPRPVVSGLLTLQPGSRLWFDGSSSVKDFTCKAEKVDATVVTVAANAAASIVAGEKSVTSADLSVPVISLDCDNGTMNGHMRKALDVKTYPTIAFALRSYDLVRSAESVAVTLTGTLTIHGTPQPVTLQAQATGSADGMLHLTGLYELNMKEYGVKPPSLMLGTMNVREKVKVRFDLLLRD
jgi:polyisoprenoid-binding protein YceI